MSDLVTARRIATVEVACIRADLGLDPVEAITQQLMRREPLSDGDSRRLAYLMDALSSAVATVRRGDCNDAGAWGFVSAVLQRQFPEMFAGGQP